MTYIISYLISINNVFFNIYYFYLLIVITIDLINKKYLRKKNIKN
jgi:hypothetical protein